ncbi:KpsF/GutQ family sugar-phosphate isomerase [Agaribacter flavus]|uniref:Arabinose 5-phosphate isomerase n=1 Tax=Agaribacter flavus TaxID=1902781 RepID=A0ABV7FPV8_9ALTE
MSYLESARRTFENQVNALIELSQSLNEDFSEACTLLQRCKGKVVVTGMGKSGHIGNKIAATLASTGTPSFFMHPAEANHGDLGMLGTEDVVVAISSSGETSELLNILPSIKRLKIPILAITNNKHSNLAKFADISLDLNIKNEACSLGLAPTTSTTATLVLGDALAIALLESKGFTQEDFAFSHPGGSLGKRLLLSVADVMVTGAAVPVSQYDDVLSTALFEISSKGLGLTSIVKDDVMIGVFTDGDLRRTLDKQVDLHTVAVEDVMTTPGYTIPASALAMDAVNMMQEKRVNALIVTNEVGKPVGALNMHMLLQTGVI